MCVAFAPRGFTQIGLMLILGASIGTGNCSAVQSLEDGGFNLIAQPEFAYSIGLAPQLQRWPGASVLDGRTLVAGKRYGFTALEHMRIVCRTRRSTRIDEAPTGTPDAVRAMQASPADRRLMRCSDQQGNPRKPNLAARRRRP